MKLDYLVDYVMRKVKPLNWQAVSEGLERCCTQIWAHEVGLKNELPSLELLLGHAFSRVLFASLITENLSGSRLKDAVCTLPGQVIDSPVPLKVVASSLDELRPLMLEQFTDDVDLAECIKASAAVPKLSGRSIMLLFPVLI